MPWKAIACSETGTSHKKSDLPCQDYASFIRVNDSRRKDNNGDIIIGAVSDGAGSCKHSKIGSALAVKTALDDLAGWSNFLKDRGGDLSPEKLKQSADEAFKQTLKKVQAAFDEEAKNKNCSPKDLSCTLLVVVATPNWLAAMQIGDGFIVIKQPESEYQLLFRPSKGEYANETTFVTASNASQMMQVEISFGTQEFICASTDGLERLAINIKDWQPHAPFFEMFKNALESRSEDEEKSSTQEWLDSAIVNNRTDDDKTLLLCWYDPSVKTLPLPSGSTKPSFLNETDFSGVIINILLGIIWNAICYDLFVDIKNNNDYLKEIICLLIATIITVIIFTINSNIYKQKLTNNKFKQQKKELLLFVIKISGIGLGLGGIFYYLSRQVINILLIYHN